MPLGWVLIGSVLPLWVLFSFVFVFSFQPKKKKKNTFFFLLDMNFDKSTNRLHFLFISFILAKFLKDQKSMPMSSIKFSNFKFL